MYDTYNSYTGAFLIAGLPPMLFGSLLSTTRCVNTRVEMEEKDPNEPKLLGPVSDMEYKEGKHSTIIPSVKYPLLLSDTNYPNYMI